jgi:hypothetical protein
MLAVLAALSAVACALAGPAVGSAAAEVPINNSPPEVAQEPGNRGQTPKVGEHLVCNPGSWIGGVSKFTYQWLREGIVVAEAEGQSDNGLGGLYTITTADEGYELWCNVIATNGSGSGEEESENSIYVPGSAPRETPPENTEKPKVEYSGTLGVGTKLKCSQGTWTGTPTPTYGYEWLQDGRRIELQTTNEYTVETTDEGHTLSCKVTATNTAGKAEAISSNNVSVKAAKPVNTKAPEVLARFAELEVGETATCTPGEWTGNPTFTYQWWREEPTKKTSEAIHSATANTYVVTSEDQLHELYCKVTATNAEGVGTEAKSSDSIPVKGSAPVNIAIPKIEYTGPLKVGTKLKCSEGKWSGDPTPHEVQVAWVRELSPTEHESVAFGTNYTAEARDQGVKLFCEVTVENSVKEKATAVSEAVVIPEEKPGGKAPENIKAPEVRGTPAVGAELECAKGEWSGNPTPQPSYQWYRGEDLIAGATEPRYTIALGDRGYWLSCKVTETNSEGTASQASTANSNAHVPGSPPENLSPPRVSGNPEVKETLTCSQGEWLAAPPPYEYKYQWLRAGSLVAAGTSYVVTAEDRGYSLTCRVTAKNTEGATAQESSNSVHIPGSEPENEKAPEVRGAGAVGVTLKCSEGKWKGAPPPTLSYQWLLDDRDIPSATESGYTVTSADQGHSLACEVTAENVEGAMAAKSKNSVSVPGVAPEDVEPPSIEGPAFVGGTLTCERGSWEGKPPPSFTYKWLVNGSVAAESVSNTYTPEASEVGQTLSCNVFAENDEGHAEAASSNSVVVGAAPTKPGPHQLVEQSAKKPAGSVDPYKTASVATAAEIRSGLSTQLTHVQRVARIASLLRHGDLSFRFAALGAGKLEVFWYEVPKGAHLASAKATPKPILVASATESYASASTKTVTLHLTKTGRRLLAHHTRITLTAEGVFVRSGASAVHWLNAFVLVR